MYKFKFFFLVILVLLLSVGYIFAQEQVDSQQQNIILRPKMEFPNEISKDPFKITLPGVKKEVSQVQEVYQEEVRLPDMIIQGIIWGGKAPLAIINNKVYKMGDSIDEAKIINIEKEGVEVILKGKSFVLPAPSKSIKIKDDIY